MMANRITALSALLAVIVAANAATTTFGLVTLSGLVATAGTWIAGLAFLARDWLHEVGGRWWVAAAILSGAALSAILSPRLALASAVAFLLAEAADWAVYARLRERSWTGAAITSNTVGAVFDSVIFLSIAGFPLAGAGAQTIVKVTSTTIIVLGVRHALLRKPLRPRGGGSNA